MVVSTINTNSQKPFSELSRKELGEELAKANTAADDDRIGKIALELSLRNNPQAIQETMEQTEAAIIEKIKQGKVSKEELKAFILKDLQSYKSRTTERVNEVQKYKEEKISSLKAQLEGKTQELHSVVTAGPNIKEYFSLERRSLVNLANSLKDLKENDKANYPKNVLIFCMGMTNTRLLGVRQLLKRWRFNALRLRKKDDIKKELEELSKRLEPDPNSKNAYREALKKLLREEVVEAKKAFVKQITEKTL